VGELRTEVVGLRQEMRAGFADVVRRLEAMVTRDDLAACGRRCALHGDVIERIKMLGEAINGGRSRRKPR
jgi:hypothetical protein